MPGPQTCRRCNAPVTIPGLDMALCATCGWVETLWGMQERNAQTARRREAQQKASAARAKAKREKGR